jgi:hypothetical protein
MSKSTHAYGITATVQQQIVDSLAGLRPRTGTKRYQPTRRMHIERDHISVVDWGSQIVDSFGVCSISRTPDRKDYAIRTPEAAAIAEDDRVASRDCSRATTRLWSWSQAVREPTGLSRSQAKALKADAERRRDEANAAAKRLVEQLHPSASAWESWQS